MARRPARGRAPRAHAVAPALTPGLRRHLLDLGCDHEVNVLEAAAALDDPGAMARLLRQLAPPRGSYLSLCRAIGAPEHFDKSSRELAIEREAMAAWQRQQAQHHRRLRDPRAVINAACRGVIQPGEVPVPELDVVVREVQAAWHFADPNERDKLRRFLLWAERESDLITGSVGIAGRSEPTVRMLVRAFERRRQWVRRPETWRRTSHNASRQSAGLLRHLFARYPVPAFMDEAWVTNRATGRRWRDWYVLIGNGQNIRTAKRLPVPISSRAAHYFLEAPTDAGILGALRYGEIRALGGDERLWRAVVTSRMPYEAASHPFWTTVLRFFIAQPLLERRHVGPIVDFLLAQRFEGAVVIRPDGSRAHLPPPQPNLSMRGRTPATLLAQVSAWHRRLGREGGDAAATVRLVFNGTGVPTMRLRDPEANDGIEWVFRELTTAVDLQLEGRRLQHCVWSYAAACARGDCSIWSLERHAQGTMEPWLTIEVSILRQVVQVRGLQNRLPEPEEVALIKRWATVADFTLSPHLER